MVNDQVWKRKWWLDNISQVFAKATLFLTVFEAVFACFLVWRPMAIVMIFWDPSLPWKHLDPFVNSPPGCALLQSTCSRSNCARCSYEPLEGTHKLLKVSDSFGKKTCWCWTTVRVSDCKFPSLPPTYLVQPHLWVRLKIIICTIPEPEIRAFWSNLARTWPEVKKPYSS